MATISMLWGEMAYCDSGGSGQPLLFLHGTGCDASDWTSVIKKLLPPQRCITLDFRGHGRSTVPTQSFTLSDLAEDVLYLINYLDLQEVVIVGHSLGGMVAMEVARCSSRVAGLVLLEGWTSLSAAGSAFEAGRFYGSLSEISIAQIQHKSKETRNRFKSQVWQVFWESVKNFDAYAYLEQADIPIYEVFGGIGRNDLTEQKLRIPSNPNIRWIWIPNAGHYLPHQCPVEVTKVVGTLHGSSVTSKR
ncbi:MAG: alpha/beta hydrolase [Candidatus Poribacteria bacterium]|nr:alpha/beta hydrolase [Candidatus Poribacteria bacterium]